MLLDPWQQEAVDALTDGENVVIDAPTTAGKTRIVEAFFEANLHRPDFRACYTCPVKSLSNDKLREFRELFGKEYVGIATGDVKENLDAPIVVATLETYRNSLLGVEPDLGRHLVIFDEYHFIQDESRGSAWEEAMILTPPSSQILLLSASVSNASDFVGWLQELSRRPARLIRVEKRPVPLVSLTWFKNHWYLPDTLPKKARDEAARRKPGHIPIDNLCERIAMLESWQLTPCIVYAGKRLSVVERAVALGQYLDPLDAKGRELIQAALDRCDAQFQSLRFMDKGLRDLIRNYGIAYHHSGLTPPVRHAIEWLVKEGSVRFCFATMGLSLGINFSVRSALISDCTRPGERGVTEYGASEILQMTGRAGRRGRDAVGFTLWPSLSYHERFGNTRREEGFSNLRKDATTFLGLISRGYSVGQIEKVYAKSFLKYQAPNVRVSLLTRDKLARKLSSEDIPCSSPVYEYSAYDARKDSLCVNCPFRKKCHPIVRDLSQGELGRLHLHLHRIGALDENDHLSAYGEIARLFPQNGGLLISKYIHNGSINSDNLLKTVQLLAACSLAHYKKPQAPEGYAFPYPLANTLKQISELYPYELFPEYYDPPFHNRHYPLFREFNATAGFLIKEWAMGYEWTSVVPMVVNEQFSDGDFTGLIYRVSSYLQSFAGLSQTHPLLAHTAQDLRGVIMREPVTFSD
jgi:superfamily II RNA helicase